jgi:hypothetical protein
MSQIMGFLDAIERQDKLAIHQAALAARIGVNADKAAWKEFAREML